VKTKRIAILGSTGSIGRQTLEVIAEQADLSACALAAGSNWRELAEQARQFSPEMVAMADESAAEALAEALPVGVELLAGLEAAVELVRRSRPDVVLAGMVGSAGLAPVLAAIECGATLALANKETLVMAGAVVMPAARAAGVEVIPVDSEHSAVFQCMAAGRRDEVSRIVLSASGGALRDWADRDVEKATVEDTLRHPTWSMGPKITVDSATMMNKALEVVEAHWLFDLPAERIDVVLHGESVFHAAVEFCDGSTIAQMGLPDMTTPIAYALGYPKRARRSPGRLDLATLGKLSFAPLNRRFARAIELGYEAIRCGGTAGAILNSANEAAVEAFLAGRIRFGQIVPLVEEALNKATACSDITLDALLAAHAWAHGCVAERIDAIAGGAISG